MPLTNQAGKPVVEEILISYGMVHDTLENEDLCEIVAQLCGRLNVSVVRTNATKHGSTEIALREETS